MGIKKTLGLGVASAALGLSLIGGGTFAYFSSTTTSTATFAAGTLKLGSSFNTPVALTNLKPGDYTVRTFTLSNDGTLDIKFLKLATSYTVTDSLGDNAGQDLGDHFKVKLLKDTYTGGSTSGYVLSEVSLKNLKNIASYDLVAMGAVPGGIAAAQSKTFKVAFEFVDNSQDQNIFQGDSLSLNWTFDALQGLGETK
ncbi:SipW-dependent-type signal peptide-containing protein [Paenibacillus tritici]|uniref:TasA family protein n=1 Tax=Paenibacillus tritici TaxID=1873425 RepID=UPI001BACD497|nr:TasA family protein [Paenibacillus tritici]QUL55380.1 SipW-dependent-type signal peptide-containing protein [Paenibacillus tritici]